MSSLPSGTVTFVLTDIEGSTRLWELRTTAMDVALERHNSILDETFSASGGFVIKGRGEGDSVFAVFQAAREALLAVVEAQRRLQREPWPEGVEVSVRMAMHTGEAILRNGEYHGHAAINRCGRLRALARGGQVLMSATTRDLLYHHLPDGVQLKSLGEHKLRDIEMSERIFQVVHADIASDFPPIGAAPRAANNLPEQLTSFVGRERELDELKTILEGSRLVTLTGSAGAGKTRLAIRVAGELLERYDDGVFMVELASLADPALLPQAIATGLDLRPPAGRSHESMLLETLKDQRRLLVIDNCEHLIEACAKLAEALLKNCPQIRVLATSREALGVPGEVSWRVPSLALSECARLFEDRAALALPGFRIDEKNVATVDALCRRLDGIPLAIELAAARVRAMPPEEILKRLENRFRLLTGGSRTAMERHQTLRAAVDWSYALLDADEKSIFCSLSVFSGDIELGAAAAVAGGDRDEYDVMDGVSRLVDKSLLIRDEGSARYRMLEMLRQYGHERLLESDGADELHNRHLEYYLKLAETSGRDTPTLLLRDLDNFRTALDWSQAADPAKGLRLITALAWLFNNAGIVLEGRTHIERLLPLVADPGPVRALGLYEAAWFAFWLGDRAGAVTYFQATADLARQLGDRILLGRALQGAGTSGFNPWDGSSSSDHLLEEALAIFRADGDIDGQAACTQTMGVGALLRGDLEPAREMLTASLELRRSIASDRERDMLLAALSWVGLMAGEIETARARISEALEMVRRSNSRPVLALCAALLALLAGRLGELEVAVICGAASVSAFEQFSMIGTYGDRLDPGEVYEAAREKLGQARLAELQAQGRAMGLDAAVEQASQRVLGEATRLRA